MKTYGLWRPVMNGAWKAPITIHCQFKNRLLTQRQHSTLQQTTWCTMLQVLPNQSYTIAYSSLIAVMSLQLTKNHSIILVPMEETLLHKLQSTESRSRYLQIPDCYKLSNGRFDVKHFLQVFYFHVLVLNCTLMQHYCQLYILPRLSIKDLCHLYESSQQ